jgi:hypothetical protein
MWSGFIWLMLSLNGWSFEPPDVIMAGNILTSSATAGFPRFLLSLALACRRQRPTTCRHHTRAVLRQSAAGIWCHGATGRPAARLVGLRRWIKTTGSILTALNDRSCGGLQCYVLLKFQYVFKNSTIDRFMKKLARTDRHISLVGWSTLSGFPPTGVGLNATRLPS